MKEPIEHSQLDPQQRLDADRGADDSARLPVVAWRIGFPNGAGYRVYEQHQPWAYQCYGPVSYEVQDLCRLTDAQSLATDLRLELNAKRLKLCAALKERNDAQARLAEKDARIAQLAAHARGKNKALANALAEVERLRDELEHDNDRYMLGRELRKLLATAQPAADGEREAFEVWAASVGYHTERDMFQREKCQSSLTWELWRVWQARAALAAHKTGEEE